MKKLNTPTKRVGGLLIVIGIIFILASIIEISSNEFAISDSPYYRSLNSYDIIFMYLERITDTFIMTLTFQTWSSRFSILMLVGFCLFIVGVLISYFYDAGIGRVVKWIRTGNW